MNKLGLAFITAFTIMSPLVCDTNAFANGGQLSRPYEWTVEIDTQELPRQFQYRNSALNQVVKTQMQYYSMNNQDDKTPYEDLWYSNARSIGMERHHKLEIKQGDAIAIRVVHKSNNSVPLDEQRAAGKAIMKAIVDANVNRNMVATIKVPMASFQNISSEIQNYDFSPAASSSGNGVEVPVNSDMNLFLESEPAGLTQSFVHYH